MKKIIILSIFFILVVFLGLLFYQSLVTNPYSPFSKVQQPFTTSLNKNGEIVLHKNAQIKVVDNALSSMLRWSFAMMRIVGASWISEKPFSGNEQKIIFAIHKERFDVSKPYIISGGHFSELYLRNLGIFYSDMLDPCIPSSQNDWQNRQRIALQTVAVDLELLRQSKREPTTFTEINAITYTPFNVYTRASDSLYAVLDVLNKLQTNQQFITQYSDGTSCHKLQTQQAAKQLLQTYKPAVKRLLQQYQQEVLDKNTFLVRRDITVSSARDGIMRSSSFYDNVVAWKTFQLAQTLGIVDPPIKLDIWKQNIIARYWLPKVGIFIDQPAIQDPTYYFSGDELMAFSVEFLDIKNSDDKKTLEAMVSYIHKYKLDEPFPLHYALKDQPNKLYFPVRFFDRHYMGESIWSHWGIEYIKLLLTLNKNQLAQQYIQKYDENIVKYGGYPELYGVNGDIYHLLFYKSVLHTGWVINFEEIKTLAKKIKN